MTARKKGSCTALAIVAGGVLAAASVAGAESVARVGDNITSDILSGFETVASMDDIRRAKREAMTSELRFEDVYGTGQPPIGVAPVGPVPCDQAFEQVEDDLNPAGTNQQTCLPAPPIPDPNNPPVRWLGNNDHCWSQTGLEDANLVENLGTLAAPGDSFARSGQTGNMDITGYAANSRSLDPDVYEWTNAASVDVKVTFFANSPDMRAIVVFNLTSFTQTGQFAPIASCSESYGIFGTWDEPQGVFTDEACTDVAWQESIGAGTWYLIITPTTEVAQNCEIWYTFTIEVIDPTGACCLFNQAPGDPLCTDGILKSACFAQGGNFRGADTTCAQVASTCCDPVADLGTTPVDYLESGPVGAFTPFLPELPCDNASAQQVNEGCVQDFNGELIPGASGASPIADNNFNVIDVCSDNGGDDLYVIQGFSGTGDSFSTSFRNSSFSSTSDDDLYTFEVVGRGVNGDEPAELTAIYDVPFDYVGYIVRDLSDPSSPSVFSLDCSLAGFLSTGLNPSCDRDEVTFCINPGVHGFLLQNFNTSNVNCQAPYTISVECRDCRTGACCLPDATCIDGVAGPTCEFDLAGSFQGGLSSCCAVTCEEPCDSSATLNGPVPPDDDCTAYDGQTVASGNFDDVNSGCDAPDGNVNDYYSVLTANVETIFCGQTGTYILETPSDPNQARDYVGDSDFYFLDLTVNDDGDGIPEPAEFRTVRFTITPQIDMDFSIVQGRDTTLCPTTQDIRDLQETSTFALDDGVTSTITVCLEPVPHLLFFETSLIIDCGFFYTVQIEYLGQCSGACCIADTSGGNSCQDLTETVAFNEGAPQNPTECDELGGTYRGLGSECATADLCCDVSEDAGDVQDDDRNNLPASQANDVNRGCIAGGTAANFQNLGAFSPGVSGSDFVAVRGSSGVIAFSAFTGAVRDNDFYSFTVDSFAELAITWEADFVGDVQLIPESILDPTGACEINSPLPQAVQLIDGGGATGPCDGPATLVLSGLLSDGSSACLAPGETYYLLVTHQRRPNPDVDYRFALQFFDCGLGACCVDDGPCILNQGILDCELIIGGTFGGDGSQCPTGALRDTFCVGSCCVDDGLGGFNCTDSQLFQECCDLNGSFAGFFTQCVDEPCIPTGACCIDSSNGFDCQELTADDCATAGGTYAGDGTLCADNPCDDFTGACCLAGGGCQDGTSPAECTALGGSFAGAGVACVDNPCTPVGACCFACAGGAPQPCFETDQAACEAAQGVYQGDGTTCAAVNNCNDVCAGDTDGDGDTDVSDFFALGGNFGTASGATRADGDLNCDGAVDVSDFFILGGDFGCAP